MKKFFFYLVLSAVLFLTLVMRLSMVLAQTPSDAAPGVLQVATIPLEPFVFFQEDGELTGFSVDLWEALAQDLGLHYKWVSVATIAQQLDAVRNGQADVAISSISMTPEREQVIDFSHPYFDAGLRILTATEHGISAIQMIEAIFTPTLLRVLGFALMTLLVMAHIIWLVERGSKEDISKAYLPGIWEALWWSFTTIVSFEYGDRVKPRSVWKRLLAMLLIVCSIILLAQFTATITASLTVQQLTNIIEGPADLPGARIVTVDGSTAAHYLEEEGLEYSGVDRIDEAYEILESGEADAVVFDSPVLLFYADHQGKGRVEIAGPIFQGETYAIVLPVNSELREPINEALLRLRQNGAYDRIYEKWFGEVK